MSEAIFFLDTNIFLQCKRLEEVTWKDVTDAETIRSFVPQAVVQELDRLKNDGDSRRAKLARDANSKFRQILQSGEKQIVIRPSDPKVVLGIAPRIRLDPAGFPTLDFALADHRMIAEILSYGANKGASEARLLTHDTIPKILADELGVSYLDVPEAWRRPPEPDERDKKIQELSRKISELQARTPLMTMSLSASGQALTREYKIPIYRHRPLASDQVKALVEVAKKLAPIATDFEKAGNVNALSLTLPSADEIHKYRAQDYPGWLAQVENFLELLHVTLDKRSRESQSFELRLLCAGVCPAERANLLIRTTGSVFLKADEPDRIRVPLPPRPPRPRSLFPDLDRFSFPVLEPIRPLNPRNPHEFYCQTDTDEQNQTWEFLCEELLHNSDPRIFKFWLVAKSSDPGPIGSLECRLLARNLQEPKVERISIFGETGERNTFEIAERLVWELRSHVV